jgi:hypothetical protein
LLFLSSSSPLLLPLFVRAAVTLEREFVVFFTTTKDGERDEGKGKELLVGRVNIYTFNSGSSSSS